MEYWEGCYRKMAKTMEELDIILSEEEEIELLSRSVPDYTEEELEDLYKQYNK